MEAICQNQAAYYTELAAITRAVLAAPLGVDINIYTDSKSSIEAVKRYLDEVNDRRKLRIAGRPFLDLIQQLISMRSGRVQLLHVHSHTDLKDQHSVGNKVADFVAGSLLRKDDKGRPLPCPWTTKQYQPIPLELGERHVVLKDHRKRVIAGDIRKTTQREAQARLIVKWRNSKSQSSFAGPFYKEIKDILFKAQSRLPMLYDTRQLAGQQRFLVQAASNTLQYRIRVEGGKRIPYEAMCHECDQIQDTWHMFACPKLLEERQATAKAIQVVLNRLWRDCQLVPLPEGDAPPDTSDAPLVCVIGWLMHRDLHNEQNLHKLQRQPDVIRACFGGFLVWEMKAELRKFAGIGRDHKGGYDVKSQNPELFQQIDSLVEYTIKCIREILFLEAYKMSATW